MRVVLVVRSDGFAGVERYLCSVAPRLNGLGCDPVVIGGDPARMTAELEGVPHLAAETTGGVVKQLARVGRCDVVHAHMSAAEVAAWLTRPRHRGVVVSTLHFATPQGRG